MAAAGFAILAAAMPAASSAHAASPARVGLTATLVGLETGFYDGWKAKSTAPFEATLAPDAQALGPFGAIDRAGQLSNQVHANAACEVRSYKLSAPRVTAITPDAAMIFYTLEQDAMCGTFKVPSPLTNVSIYARRDGRWVNVLRASQPLQPAPAAGGQR